MSGELLNFVVTGSQPVKLEMQLTCAAGEDQALKQEVKRAPGT